jgi:hypothetical protein
LKHLKIILLTTLSGLALSFTGFSQSCLPEGITFSTQSQIDSFQINYPNCTEIEGDVIISGSNISNLIGLSVISWIKADLVLYSNPLLISLDGLNGLITVDGNINIGYEDYYGQTGNPSLVNLSGLNNLSLIGDSLVIIKNPSLTSIGALANLTSIGSIVIKNNTSLINLTGLEGLTFIAGGLTVFYNPALTNLSGFINLSSIYDDLYLYSNGSLTSLTGLDNLTCIGGSLTIIGHSSLTSLTGLEGLTFIGDDLNINVTQDLKNLKGLDNLAYVVNDLSINSNWILDNLTGLEGLDSIGGNLEIYQNNYLTCLTGIENLNSIGGHITIGNNYRLFDITGLENIDANSISYLNIYANDALSNCDVKSICDFLAIPNSYSQFYANASGCNSTAEVEADCLVGINDKTNSANRINIFPNPSSGKITLEIKEPQHQSQLSIFNLNGQELLKQQITEPTKEIDISHLTGGIYFVKFSNDSEVKIFKIVKNYEE